MFDPATAAAQTSRLHRLTAPRKSRIEVTERAILIKDTSGITTAELPVNKLDDITLEQGLLWSGISFRMVDGSSYSVGGLPHEDARKILARCRDEIARYASTVRDPLSALVESISRVLVESRYTRHSEGEKLYPSLHTGLRGLGREVRNSLAASEARLLDCLAPLGDRPAFKDARGRSNDAYMRNILPSVREAALPVRLTDEIVELERRITDWLRISALRGKSVE